MQLLDVFLQLLRSAVLFSSSGIVAFLTLLSVFGSSTIGMVCLTFHVLSHFKEQASLFAYGSHGSITWLIKTLIRTRKTEL